MEVKAALEMTSDSRTAAEWTFGVTHRDNSQLQHYVRGFRYNTVITIPFLCVCKCVSV